MSPDFETSPCLLNLVLLFGLFTSIAENIGYSSRTVSVTRFGIVMPYESSPPIIRTPEIQKIFLICFQFSFYRTLQGL